MCYINWTCSKKEFTKNSYFEGMKKLNDKKEKLWSQGDISKWDIVGDISGLVQMKLKLDKTYTFSMMCTQETNHMINLWNTLGYYNRPNMQEMKKLISNNCNRYNFIQL